MAGSGNGHVTRSRWTGPGLVILQNGHSVYVSMRSRLLKCNSDQLRPASHEESVGAELLRSGELSDLSSQISSHRAGAVDVAREGSPPSEAWDQNPQPELLPRLPPQEALDSIPEDQPVEPTERQGQHHLLREASVPPAGELSRPEPIVPRSSGQLQARQVSVEEPHVEPSVASADGSSEVTSAPPTPGRKREATPRTPAGPRVKRQVDELEQKERERRRLENIAIQMMRKEQREERLAKRMQRSEPYPTARSEFGSEDRDPSASASASGMPPLSSEATEQAVETDELLSCFALKVQSDGKSFVVGSGAKAKNTEFDMSTASPEQLEGFRKSDIIEWDAIKNMGAVEVLTGAQAQEARAKWGHRIVTSRMVRRLKPQPGIGNYKFKSRWCVHGHRDPDGHMLQTYSPMPSTESIVMFYQICLNLGFKVSIADVTNAFCQSKQLQRAEGPLFVEPCSGLNLPKGSVIRLVVPVYGLDDAPLAWHQTVVSFFESIGFTRSLLEPCWMIRRQADKIQAMVLIEVDDINVGATEDYAEELAQCMKNRFVFGKWEHQEADFAGRRVKVCEDRVLFDQEKYIIEKLHPVKLAKGRASQHDSLLDGEEFESFRSLLYRVNWIAHQTRPEASGVVSLLSSRLKNASVHDLTCLNKLVVHLRNTAQQHLVLHKFRNDRMHFICASDAGGIDGKPPVEDGSVVDTTQGAWVIMAAEENPSASRKTKVSVLSWRSTKLRRRVASTLAAEALAFSQSLGEMEWLQIMFRDVVYGDVCRKDWRSSLLPFIAVLREDCELHQRLPQCSITDAKSLFDAIKRGNSASRQDRRTSVELALINESMAASQGALQWAPHPRMIADCLTKDDISKSNGALEELLRTGKLCI